MTTLIITSLKPNPAGKDRNRHGGASPGQLGAEWVQFENRGSAPADLSGVELYHLAYSDPGAQPKWEKIMHFSGALGPGKSLRVHSGRVRELSVLRPEDFAGADHHLFTGRDAYVWNNAEGDTAALWHQPRQVWIDQASYDPWPPEGVVLVRVASKLVPSGIGVRTR